MAIDVARIEGSDKTLSSSASGAVREEKREEHNRVDIVVRMKRGCFFSDAF